MRSAVEKRFFALSFIGCVLLLVYQIVFMARTSAARDLNHIRATQLTIQQAERFVLHNVNETRVAATIADIAYGISAPSRIELLLDGGQRTRARRLSHLVSPMHIRSALIDDDHLPILPSSSVFRLAKAPTRLEVPFEKVLVMRYNRLVSIDDLVRHAMASGFEAIIYVIPPDWAPKFGARDYEIPIATALRAPLSAPRDGSVVTFVWGPSDDIVIEKSIPGHVSEIVLVGNSAANPESLAIFAEMLHVFDALVARGWKPYRTIEFVSFPQYMAAAWARDHARWLSQYAVAYIDTSSVASVSASPLLNRTLNWAVDTLKNGGLCDETPARSDINPPDGANVFQFEFQVPSVAAALGDPASTSRLLNLILASLASEPVVPFVVSDYSAYLNSTEFLTEAASFDAHLDFLKFEFTREYPWYQGVHKLRSVMQLKRANMRLVRFEQQLRNKAGTYVIFANNHAGTGTTLMPVPSDVSSAVTRILDSGILVL